MESSNLQITLSNPDGSNEEYWIRIEQEDTYIDLVKKSEISEISDAIFSLSPCTLDSTPVGGETLPVLPYIDNTLDKAKEIARIASDILGSPLCSGENVPYDLQFDPESGEWVAKLRVYRSHVCDSYSVNLTVGEVISTIRHREDIRVAVQVNGFYTYIDPPISKKCSDEEIGYTYIFESNSPVKKIEGSTIYFNEYVETLILSYTTEWDVVTIRIPGTGEFTRKSIAFCNYHSINVSETLNPLDDGSITNPCVSIDFSGISDSDSDSETSIISGNQLPPPSPDDRVCFQKINVTEKCFCEGKVRKKYTRNIKVACPEASSSSSIVGKTLSETSYTYCGITDEYSTAAFFEKSCCTTGISSVQCKIMKYPWSMGADFSNLKKYKSRKNTSLIPVPPDSGNCGEHIIEQQVTGSCCEGVDNLRIVDVDPSTIESSVMVKIEGGIAPIEWKVSEGYVVGYDITSTPATNSITSTGTGGCYGANVKVKSTCGVDTIFIPFNTDLLSPLKIDSEGGYTMVSPDTTIILTASGGRLPYKWSSSKLTLVESDKEWAKFYVPQDFCGMGSVSVSDDCGTTSSLSIKSTAGEYSVVEQTNSCNPPSGGYTPETEVSQSYAAISGDGEYRIGVYNGQAGWYQGCEYPPSVTGCPVGNVIVSGDTTNKTKCESYSYINNDATYLDGCCKLDFSGINQDPGTSYMYLIMTQGFNSPSKWVC